MLTDSLLEQLLCKGEGIDLDYKSERYPFIGAGKNQKSELLKDILAFANTNRTGTAYILIGFKENPPYPVEVVGLSSDETIDDSQLQQFVNEKLARKLGFRYEERIFLGKPIAVISIPKQKRPFYLKKDYGGLPKNTVWVRRGSSTEIATPDEIAAMSAEDIARDDAKVELVFQNGENLPLPHEFQIVFHNFPENIPDYHKKVVKDSSGYMSISFDRDNKDYWREFANYCASLGRIIELGLSLENQSGYSLSDTRLEITCDTPVGESVTLLNKDEIPGKPQMTHDIMARGQLRPLHGFSQKLRIDNRGIAPVANFELGMIRPGQFIRPEDDLVILPSGPGLYMIQVRLLANELPEPLVFTHELNAIGEVKHFSESEYPPAQY